MSCWKGEQKKGKRECRGKNLQKYGSTVRRKCPFFSPFLFWYCFCGVWYPLGIVKSDRILGVVLYGLFMKWLQILIVCGIFCNVWVWLEWLGKNWMWIGIFLSPRVLISLNSIQKMATAEQQLSIVTLPPMPVTEQTSSRSTMSCQPLSDIFPKTTDMNTQVGKDKNNKFCLHNSSKRNGKYLTDFSLEKSLACLNNEL